MTRLLICGLAILMVFGALGLRSHEGVVLPKVYIVDRIEEDLVIVEWERGHFKIPKDLFKGPVHEGDVLQISIDIDTEATASRRKKIRDLMQFDEY